MNQDQFKIKCAELIRNLDNISKEDISTRIQGLAVAYSYTGETQEIIQELCDTYMTKKFTDDPLFKNTDKYTDRSDWVHTSVIKWTYLEEYGNYLMQNGWNAHSVASLNETSKNILNYLTQPGMVGGTATAWDDRGLVIGHVQSGKTASYTGLITAAADAGYKCIIVLTGISNVLRMQTQKRLEIGFVGRDTSMQGAAHKKVGVGLIRPNNILSPITLTNSTVDGDFDYDTADNVGLTLRASNAPLLLVLKKNASVLKSVKKWLVNLNADPDGKIRNIPLLVIDDEADNASINTKANKSEATKINRLIRDILNIFSQSAFVGYTATPFANIYIEPALEEPESDDNIYDEDLYPRDFIHLLNPPQDYDGADKFFNDSDANRQYVKIIDDCENFLPMGHPIETVLGKKKLPQSLQNAICTFILAKAIRCIRGDGAKHCSMMINMSQYTDIQDALCNKINNFIKKLRENPSDFRRMFMDVFEREYSRLDNTYNFHEQIWPIVEEILESDNKFNLKTFLVNSNQDNDKLIPYDDYKDPWLMAIVIGGYSLSRGLTLEGLCVSYLYRNTQVTDTLMQMARWFGYHHGFSDLCRVYLAEESNEWYKKITSITRKFLDLIRGINEQGNNPGQDGLYVIDDGLQPTAASKMRHAFKIYLGDKNFSGRTWETDYFVADQNKQAKNLGIIKNIHDKYRFSSYENGFCTKNVPLDQLKTILQDFECHERLEQQKEAVITYLDKISGHYPKGDILIVSTNKQPDLHGGIGFQSRGRTVAAKGNAWFFPKGRISAPGVEIGGLTPRQIEKAKDVAEERGNDNPYDEDFRQVRNKPLVMLHILKLPDNNFYAGLGVSFPYNDEDEDNGMNRVIANIAYVVRHKICNPDD